MFKSKLIKAAMSFALLGTLIAIPPISPVSAADASCPNGYVALTFDDGPSNNTNNILNALKQAGLRATMFNTGQNSQNNQALVRAQVSAGMWIGNHSYTHPDMTKLNSSQMASEISRTQDTLRSITGSSLHSLGRHMVPPTQR